VLKQLINVRCGAEGGEKKIAHEQLRGNSNNPDSIPNRMCSNKNQFVVVQESYPQRKTVRHGLQLRGA
jgi:hypothetical protein